MKKDTCKYNLQELLRVQMIIDQILRYFVSKSDQAKVRHRENPLLIKIIKIIKANYSGVKYSTYRAVLKLRKLQRELNTGELNTQLKFEAANIQQVFILFSFSILF